jgi:hypothetical protein
MKKLRFDVKDLRIESFEPAAQKATKRGGVFAQNTCGGTDTCQTCDHTAANGFTCSICTTDCEFLC